MHRGRRACIAAHRNVMQILPCGLKSVRMTLFPFAITKLNYIRFHLTSCQGLQKF